MINNFFKKTGRFIKMFLFILVFFISTKPLMVNAAELSDFVRDTNNIIPKEVASIGTAGVNSNGVNLQINLQPFLTVPPSDSNGNKILDENDELGDFWDSLLDNGIGDSSDGIYLKITKKSDNTSVSFTVPENAGQNGMLDNLFVNTKNITKSFWVAPSNFFGKETFASIIGVSGLEPDTEYYAQLIFEEDKSTDALESIRFLFKTTKTDSGITIQQTATTVASNKTSNAQIDFCAGTNFINSATTSVYCAIAKFWVNIITFIPNMIAAVVGILNDIVINISVGYGVYNLLQDLTFDAWKIVRDFSNIIIILSLFIAAFSLILGGGDGDGPDALQKFGDPKKIVVNVVMVAIFINFSFFFSRVIIDTGNITAKFLYNQISVDGDIESGSFAINIVKQATGVKKISLAMLSQVQPQALLSTDEARQVTSGDTITAYLAVGHLVLLFDIILIYIFSIMLFLFMGRIVMLNLLVILSPIAFASYPIPFLRNKKFIGFNNWLSEIIGNAFLGTIFLFFIYLSVLFSKIDITAASGDSGLVGFATGFLLTVVGMLFKVALMFGIIFKGKSLAMDMAGTMGEYVSKAAGWATSIAAGAATGGTALLARQTVGRLGSSIANNVEGSNIFSRGIRSMGNKLGAASFDVRNSTGIMSRFNKATNTLGGGTIPTGDTLQRKGGFIAEGTLADQYRKRQEEIEKKKIAEREAIAATLVTNAQAKPTRELRELEDTRNQTNQAITNKKSEIESAAYRTTIDKAVINKHQEVVDDVDKHAERIADLDARENTARADGTYTAKKSDFDRERLEIDKKKEKAEKGYEKAQNALIAIKEQDGKDLRTINNEIAKENLRAESSKEFKDREKAKTDAEKSKTDAVTAETELKNFRKRLEALNKKTTKTPEEIKTIADMKTQETELEKILQEKQAENNKKQADFKQAEKDYNTAFGDKIKALQNAVSDSVKNYSTLRQSEISTLQDTLKELDIKIIDKKFEVSEKGNLMKEKYANKLENRTINNPTGSSITSTIGTITGGAVFGGQVRNTNNTAANNIRGSINGKK